MFFKLCFLSDSSSTVYCFILLYWNSSGQFAVLVISFLIIETATRGPPVNSSKQPLLFFICEQRSCSHLLCFIANNRICRQGTIGNLFASLSYSEGRRSQYRGFSCGCCGSFGTKLHGA
ncbi:hypothetical protein NA56DRAFT_245765 [Hyaloscypha hepaticicola]|uniref:Uncharacterized protein n=1 Tax=Hyaloscypha hepaticicola TaxID=2082293 RepID=A0A2J6PW79_9HELO|nr:hypothetical protein NA56DRAFT_245765 [Hyaloscypha hepaticicola]